MKIKKGDNVIVITGKDKGRTGQVLVAIPAEDRVVVEGVNVAKRHTKARKPGEVGEIKDVELSIHVSNVAILGANGKPVKVSYKVIDDKKVRVNRQTGVAL